MSKNIYFSAALASSADIKSDQSIYEEIAENLSKYGLNVHLPHKNFSPLQTHHQNIDVFSGDLHNLLEADLVVALLDTPSFGVGAEIVFSINNNIPVYGFYKHKTSRFILGFLDSHPLGNHIQVKSYREIPDIIFRYISK